jgi:hypothetical protein
MPSVSGSMRYSGRLRSPSAGRLTGGATCCSSAATTREGVTGAEPPGPNPPAPLGPNPLGPNAAADAEVPEALPDAGGSAVVGVSAASAGATGTAGGGDRAAGGGGAGLPGETWAAETAAPGGTAAGD